MGTQQVRLQTIAPAKINWTLEVLGRRQDGYHEIRSLMQTIDLCDELEASSAPDLLARSVVPENPPPGSVTLRPLPHLFSYAGNESVAGYDGVLGETVVRALWLLDPEGRKDARIGLTKKIPIAAGLGGGSSDAAATMRVLQRLWALGWEQEQVVETAAQIGSDVPFFLSGGTALAEGRGERVMSLSDAPLSWLVLLAPPIKLPEKTRRMYEAITPEDFTEGSRSEALLERLRQGKAVREEDLYNAFENRAYQMFEGLSTYGDVLLAAGAPTVHVAGAGPALFTFAENEAAAREIANRVQATNAKVFVARTVTAAEATAIVE
jgi:4-diphosphocytidyl-2-C-methyl-D-erythritol kinase